VQVVPVIDLLEGQVVRARQGERASYRPIESSLASGSDAVDIVRAFLRLHPFSALYVADLDAIQGKGDNLAALRRLRAAFPHLGLWVDNGAADAEAVETLTTPDLRCDPVLGAESQRDASLVARHRDSPAVILSLDFRGPVFQGPEEILASPQCWPRRVIVMTLARVGSAEGPDFERLAAIHDAAPDRALYAAGGARSRADLVLLKSRGAAGALIASALHDGRLTAADLAAL